MNWIEVLKSIGPLILKLTPLRAIAPFVIDAIAEAEALHGEDKGPQKLDHAANIAVDIALTAYRYGSPIDPESVRTAAHDTISAVVNLTNIVHQAQRTIPTTP